VKQAKTYFTGKPCRNGHLANRRQSDGLCVECSFLRAKKYRTKFHVKVRTARQQYRRGDGWAINLVGNLKLTAQRLKIPFDLSIEDILALIPASNRCPVFDIPLVFGERAVGTASVDRIIPALGYVKGNVAIISLRANQLKRDCTDSDELRKIADYIDRCTAAGASWIHGNFYNQSSRGV
jgi:hypothetical protein